MKRGDRGTIEMKRRIEKEENEGCSVEDRGREEKNGSEGSTRP